MGGTDFVRNESDKLTAETMGDRNFVRNESDKQVGSPFSLKLAFSCAASGFLFAVRTQRNMRIHLLAIVFVIVLGLALRIAIDAWPPLILCIGLVLAAECVNTALETLADRVSSDYDLPVRRAKDCAAAAVLVSAAVALVVGACVFIPAALVLVQDLAGSHA